MGMARPTLIPASRLPGTELIALGGSESFALPEVRALPIGDEDRERGLAGAHLVLPPPSVRMLREVHLQVSSGHLSCGDGLLVAESVPATDRGMRSERRRRNDPVEVSGNVTPYGSSTDDVCARLTETLPKLVILQHPAVRRFGPVTVVHAGMGPLERFVLTFRDPDHLILREFDAAAVVQGERTVLPGPVTRAGTAALPTWFRQWLDRHLADSSPPGASLMVALMHGPTDPLNDPGILDILGDHGFVVIDTKRLTIGDADSSETIGTLVGAVRDASVIVGASDSALSHVAFSRKARIVHVGTTGTVTARPLQVAVSKGLEYHFTKPALLEPTLTSVRHD